MGILVIFPADLSSQTVSATGTALSRPPCKIVEIPDTENQEPAGGACAHAQGPLYLQSVMFTITGALIWLIV